MTEIYIALAVPVFFALIGVEALVAWWRGLRVYRFVDAVACLSCGIGQQMTGLLWKALILGAYVLVWQHAALLAWDGGWWGTWVVAMLLVDHQYYWWHRTTHRSRLFWATHVVHHQSEDYNLAVALRQAWFSSFSSLPFYLPLALLGIPPLVFAVSNVLNTLYQFWIHTELVGRLGPLEAVLNTPSHHRVHHGVDPRYIDRNHAGVLIVWDRLYGTFEREAHRPTYGTVTPLKSTDPVWANVEPWVAMARDLRRIRGLGDKARYLLGPPEWRPAELGGAFTIPEPEPHRVTWDPRPPAATQAYVAGWFGLTTLAATGALAYAGELPWAWRAVVVSLVLWTTVTWSALHEGRTWARPVELTRLGVLGSLAAGLYVAGALGPLAAAVGVGVAAASAGWLAATPAAVPAGAR